MNNECDNIAYLLQAFNYNGEALMTSDIWAPGTITALWLRGRASARHVGSLGLISGPCHTKTFFNGTRCSVCGVQCKRYSWDYIARFQYHVTRWGIMSSVWNMIFQWGSIIKFNIGFTITTTYCCDMTERLLKATLNTNQPTNLQLYLKWCILSLALSN